MMTFGGPSPIEYKINSFIDIDPQKDYIVIIGASNSLMNNGWAFHLTKILGHNCVVNLSLGATCSSYIAFVFLMFSELLAGAKHIIIEPFVNDVSFFGNGDYHENFFRISTCGNLQEGSLKSKYLKLTSFPFNTTGPFLIKNDGSHSIGLGGFLLARNSLQDFYRGGEYQDNSNKQLDRIHAVLLE